MPPKFLNIRVSVFLVLLLSSIIGASQDSISMQEIIPLDITAERSVHQNTVKLSRKDFLTQPASFDDPSRLILKQPGYATQNDQSNFIIKDGLPPQFSDWTIYNAKIINPNHLSNAGTIDNRFSSTAGGVNIFSGQVIGNYKYFAQPHSEINTSIAGTSDLSFRTPYKNQIALNLSLLGLEGGVDNAYGDKIKSSINARYSTVDLLDQWGVSFGDEKINYGDVFGQVHFDINKNASLSMYFVGGKSGNNKFRKDSIDALTYNDLLSIDYESEIFIGGLQYQTSTPNAHSTFSLAVSKRYDNYRQQSHNFSMPDLNLNADQQLMSIYLGQTRNVKQAKLSYAARLNYSKHLNLFNIYKGDMLVDQNADFNRLDLEYNINLSHDINKSFSYNVGMGLDQDSRSQQEATTQLTLLPNALVKYTFRSDWSLNASMSHSSQEQSPLLYSIGGGVSGLDQPYQTLESTKGRHTQLRLQQTKWNSSLSLFHHFIYDIPHATLHPLEYSYLNNFDQITFQSGTDNLSKAISFGAKFITSQKWNGWRMDYNLTIFKLRQYIQTDRTDVRFPPPYAHDYATNLTISKENVFTRGLYFGFSIHSRGGMNEKKIDLAQSIEKGRTIYDINDPFTQKLAPLYRVDLRVNYTFLSSSKFKSMLSLDIQNVSNRLNDAFHFYDPFLEKVQLKKQLGLIPVLSWRVVIS